MQDAQDELNTELRLLRHEVPFVRPTVLALSVAGAERVHCMLSLGPVVSQRLLLRHVQLTASQEFLAKRMGTVDDAVECVRNDMARAGEQQFESQRLITDSVATLDEKLFALDKELLKVKLALPSATAAQLIPAFAERHSMGSTSSHVELPSGGMVVQQKLQELSLDIMAL